MMRAGRGDFERAARLRLAAHVGEIRRVRDRMSPRGFARASARGKLATSGEMRAHREQRIGDAHVGIACERSFVAVAARHDDAASGSRRVQHGRQHAVHGAQFARERELADEFVRGERIARNAAVRGEDAERDRKIEATAVLGQIRRREIDGDLALRIVELRVEDRRAHAIARFLHGGFGQADDRRARQTAGKMHFAGDQRRGHAVLRPAVDDGETHQESVTKSRPLPRQG